MATVSSRLVKLEAFRRVVKPALVLITHDDAELTEEQEGQKAQAEREGRMVKIINFVTV